MNFVTRSNDSLTEDYGLGYRVANGWCKARFYRLCTFDCGIQLYVVSTQANAKHVKPSVTTVYNGADRGGRRTERKVVTDGQTDGRFACCAR